MSKKKRDYNKSEDQPIEIDGLNDEEQKEDINGVYQSVEPEVIPIPNATEEPEVVPIPNATEEKPTEIPLVAKSDPGPPLNVDLDNLNIMLKEQEIGLLQVKIRESKDEIERGLWNDKINELKRDIRIIKNGGVKNIKSLNVSPVKARQNTNSGIQNNNLTVVEL